MSESIVKEAVFLLHCISAGVLITFTYDLLLICRNCFKHGRILISIEDLLYWIVCAIFIFLVLYCENDGILRGYCIMGAAVGMLVYKKWFSPYIVHFMSTIFKKVIDVVAGMMRKLMFPFRMLFSGIRKCCAKIWQFFTKKKKEVTK